MIGYTPLFGSIITSSIWNEDDSTRIVWITLLAMADMHGVVEGSIPGLAVVARVSTEACEKGIKALLSPDKYSRTKEHEGRRIVVVDGGWKILNHGMYRQKAKSRGADQRRYRERKKLESSSLSNNKLKQQTTNANSVAPRDKALRNASRSISNEFDDEFWPKVPHKINKKAAKAAYIKARKITPKEVILAGLPNFKAYERWRGSQPDYRPLHPSTWLNNERWQDEPIAIPKKETTAEQIARVRKEGKYI